MHSKPSSINSHIHFCVSKRIREAFRPFFFRKLAGSSVRHASNSTGNDPINEWSYVRLSRIPHIYMY